MLVAATAKLFSLQVAVGVRWPSPDAPEERFTVNAVPPQPFGDGYIDVQEGRADDMIPARRSPISRYSSLDRSGKDGSSRGSNRTREFPAPTIVYGPSSATFSRYFECGRNLDCLA
jgi:hypothetical protein